MSKKSIDLKSENNQLKDLVYTLNMKNEQLENDINKITSSKTYKLWQSYVRSKKQILSSTKDFLKALLPITYRKKFKFFIKNRISARNLSNNIDPLIVNEWDTWHKNRSKNSYDVINFGITNFDYRTQRPQHLARELAHKGNRVFYIETDFNIYNNNTSLAPITIKPTQYKYVYKVTISTTKNLFIYQDILSSDDIDIMVNSFKNLLKEAKIINPIAKIDHPFWAPLINKISIPVIYDCMDKHQGFKETSKAMIENEDNMFKNSDGVIVSSDILYKFAESYKPKRLIMIKNAGDYEHFNKIQSDTFSNIIEKIPKPIIGYYGSLSDWFDTAILEKIALKFPKASIVLIGRVENPRIQKLANTHKNIFLLGEKPYELLPLYLSEFNVCIIPFILNDLIKATNPVKIFEYFSQGKPVVATNMPELASFKESMYVAENTNQFLEGIEKSLNEKNEHIRKKRIEIAKINTWYKRGETLHNFIYNDFFPKVSIVVLVFNKPELTQKCIDSILNRSFYPNLELIIVDNGSDKKTVQMLMQYKHNKQVKIIFNKKNIGFAAGNNIGMKKAAGEYIIVLNNDTVVTPGWIERLVFHVKPDTVGLVGPVTNNIGNEAKIDIDYIQEDHQDMENKAAEYTVLHWGETLKLQNLAAFCWILKKNTYKKIGGFDERYGRALFEDDDYCMRIKEKNLAILCTEDVFIHHFGSASVKEINSEAYTKLFEENKKKFEEKWKTKWIPHKYRKK